MKKLLFPCLLTLVLLLQASCEHTMHSETKMDNAYTAEAYDMELLELPSPPSSGEVADTISGEHYEELPENPFLITELHPVSTFSIDADGASYANMRRLIRDGGPIPAGAVRTEELLNYFDLDYPYSDPSHPIALNGEISSCPWAPNHRLVRIGIEGQPLPSNARPASNFVFLIDVSGSMAGENELGLLKAGFQEFANGLTAADRVAIVTYAGNAGLHLPATSGDQKAVIKKAIKSLGAGGSTAGAAGILTAYEIAEAQFIPNGNNRIILGTDGDFNVGISDHDELIELIEEKRESGIYLTVLGVGYGNYNDATLEQIANHGNGTFEYIDDIAQMNKVFIYEYDKFYAVAKDVKVQVNFNPEIVESYRLIGYENRMLNEEDFEDDEKDAGEIGAGQNITALYEVVPQKNQVNRNLPALTVDFRYKRPDAIQSQLLQLDIQDQGKSFANSSDYQRFTTAVAAFSLLLRGSETIGETNLDDVEAWLATSDLKDEHGFKAEFKELVKQVKLQ